GVMADRPRPPAESDSLLARMGKDRFVLGFVTDHLAGMPGAAQAAARELAKSIERINLTQGEVLTSLSEGFGRVKSFQESGDKLGEFAESSFERLEGVGESLRKALADAADLVRAVGKFDKPDAEASARTTALEQTARGV